MELLKYNPSYMPAGPYGNVVIRMAIVAHIKRPSVVNAQRESHTSILKVDCGTVIAHQILCQAHIVSCQLG